MIRRYMRGALPGHRNESTHTYICMQTRTLRDLRAGDTCAYMVNGKVIQLLAKRLEKTLLRSL